MKTEISGSNCPAGARVATVSESNGTDYLVCLSDCKAGPALLRAVRRLSLAGSLLSRRLGDAMRFVARHVFKRVRAGHLLRKVAVFFKAGPTRDAGSISTTRLELSVLDITAVVITFTEDHNLPDALLTAAHQASLSSTISQNLLKFMSIESEEELKSLLMKVKEES